MENLMMSIVIASYVYDKLKSHSNDFFCNCFNCIFEKIPCKGVSC